MIDLDQTDEASIWSKSIIPISSCTTVPLFRVVLLVEPKITTGRTYTIPQNVNKAASAILKDTTEFLYNRFHYFACVSGIKRLIYPEPILIPNQT